MYASVILLLLHSSNRLKIFLCIYTTIFFFFFVVQMKKISEIQMHQLYFMSSVMDGTCKNIYLREMARCFIVLIIQYYDN